MKLKQSILCSDSGFTLVELLVASVIALLVMAMAAESTTSLRNLYLHDIVRTRLNQDMRASLDLIGVNIRQAGENFSASFPAIEIIDGGSGADELVMRRNLIDEVLNVCADISGGTAEDEIEFANGGVQAGCSYSSNAFGYSTWSAYRLADENQQVRAYMYNIGNKTGEFFDYVGETDTGAELRIATSGSTWTQDYPVGTSAVYLIEEWRFRLNGDVLELIIDGDDTSPLNVAFGLTEFQVTAVYEDGSTATSLDVNDDWTELAAIEVSLSAQDTFANRIITSSLSSRFFPRNILSN